MTEKDKMTYKITSVSQTSDYFKVVDKNTKESIKDYYYRTESKDGENFIVKYFIGKLFIVKEITSYTMFMRPIYEDVYYFVKYSENSSKDDILYRSIEEMPIIYEEDTRAVNNAEKNTGAVNNDEKNTEAEEKLNTLEKMDKIGRGGGGNRSRGKKRSRRNKKQRKNKTKSKK
jgi:hypothetical protein